MLKLARGPLLSLLPISVVSVMVLGCGGSQPGAVTDPVKPDKPTAGKALGEEPLRCDPAAMKGKLSPLIVDWKSTKRGDLEAAMADGVAVVKLTCEGIEVLPDCRVAGDYGFRAISVKRDNTLIEGRDAISASFGGIVGGVAADLSRNAKLDLATVLVGKRATTRISLYRGEVAVGEDCDQATHFIRRADVGAFAMTSGTSVEAGAAAKIMGQGVETSSGSKEVRSNRDGEPTSCSKLERNAANPPERCGALIRVSLSPIKDGDGPTGAEAQKAGVDEGYECPDGFVFSDGACVEKSDKVSFFLCDEGNTAQCREQCLAGSNPSCGRLAKGVIEKEDEGAAKQMIGDAALTGRMNQACDDDEANACSLLAIGLMVQAIARVGDETPTPEMLVDLQDVMTDAHRYLDKSCSAGEGRACEVLRDSYLKGDLESVGIAKNPIRYMVLLKRACRSGSAPACATYARELIIGKLMGRHVKDALQYAEKACYGGFSHSCAAYAAFHAPHEVCIELFQRAKLQDSDGNEIKLNANEMCSREALAAIRDDRDKAFKFLRRGCSLGDKAICAIVKEIDG